MTGQFPKILAGRYEIREMIGRGGMAEVHLGYDRRLSRIIAIKLLRSDIAGDPTFQARFRREAQSAAALNHPSIVSVYDSGEEQVTTPNGAVRSVPYIVMEYVEGHTVREFLGEGEAVPIPEAVEIVTGVLDALEYSHRAGIIHRDIKPGNIMLTSTGAVKVMDFGIARAVEDSAATVTQTHAVVGTAQYLSPEQARGEVVDARSDLYSAGCLLYELLTGKPPFTGDSAVAIAYQHVREIPRPPSAVAADVPESLDRVVLKALAKNRDDRYQDASHMRADLLAAARGLSVSAPSAESWSAPAPAMAAGSPSPAPAPAPPAPPAPPMARRTRTPPAAAESEGSRGSSRRWGVWVLLILVLIAAGAGIGMLIKNATAGRPAPTPSATVTAAPVPNVAGMSESDARSAIEGAGLKFVKGDDVASDTVDAGKAVSSDPGAGASVGRGETVSVVISSGRTTVPQITNLELQEAQDAITAAGLTYNSSTVEATTTDSALDGKSIITAVNPAEGPSLEIGRAVNITVTHYTLKAQPTASAPTGASPKPAEPPGKTPSESPTKND